MKTLLLPLTALLLSFAACAQSSQLEKVYQQYNSGDNSIGIDPGLLLNVSFSSKKISALHCLLIDGKKSPNAGREFRDLEHAARADHFEEWFSIRKGKGRVQLLSREGKDDLEEVVCLIVGDDDGGLFIHLRGHFTAADKARLEAALQDHDSQ
ncbi:DUF4252 domain-containing protein [Puia sp.]|jgi:hypothetical protein|uniref:DUF4252 domain-containing protein n=1 Tax=Puia sp. TaxID=2045100 RepID=UPI002F413D87